MNSPQFGQNFQNMGFPGSPSVISQSSSSSASTSFQTSFPDFQNANSNLVQSNQLVVPNNQLIVSENQLVVPSNEVSAGFSATPAQFGGPNGGAVGNKKPKINIYKILGFIRKISYSLKRNSEENSLRDENGNADTRTDAEYTIHSIESKVDHEIRCPFPCQARRDDVISGVCEKDLNGQFKFIMPPIIEPNSSRDAVKTSFIIPLKGTHFGEAAAEKLYKFFETQARQIIETAKHDNKDAILRNKNSLCHATMEIITKFAERYQESSDTIDPLLEHGLSKEQAGKLLKWWYNNVPIRRLILLGLTKKEIQTTTEHGWKLTDLYYQLITNPYTVIDVPMDMCQNICNKFNLQFSPQMIEAADLVRFVDMETEKRKWACFPVFRLEKTYQITDALKTILTNDFKCEFRYNCFYLEHHKIAEDVLTRFMKPIRRAETFISERSKNKLCPEQIEALTVALNNNISLITGGAGTGKSTLICALAEELDLRGISYVITAYTGKAVARLKQIFKRDDLLILTLHMLMSRFKALETRVDYVIVDEVSMVPNNLLARVLLRVNDYSPQDDWVHNYTKREIPMSVVLVGDKNQVQPIDWGNLMNEIVDSKLPTKHLSQDHRRTKKSALYENVHNIATIEDKTTLNFKWGDDCNFVKGDIAEVESVVASLLKYNNHHEITVLSPYNDHIEDLNNRILNLLINKDSPFIEDAWGKKWYVGSRVMMTTNRYDLGHMNGEEGEIIAVNHLVKNLTVRFSGCDPVNIPTHVPQKDMEDLMAVGEYRTKEDIALSTQHLTLSWCITVMRSQGSEWKHVILYLPPKTFTGFYMNWKLFYTAISRAKDSLIIVANNYQNVLKLLLIEPFMRYDNLRVRLNESVAESQYLPLEYVAPYAQADPEVRSQNLIESIKQLAITNE